MVDKFFLAGSSQGTIWIIRISMNVVLECTAGCGYWAEILLQLTPWIFTVNRESQIRTKLQMTQLMVHNDSCHKVSATMTSCVLPPASIWSMGIGVLGARGILSLHCYHLTTSPSTNFIPPHLTSLCSTSNQVFLKRGHCADQFSLCCKLNDCLCSWVFWCLFHLDLTVVKLLIDAAKQ